MFEMLCINTSRTVYYIDIYSTPFLGFFVALSRLVLPYKFPSD